MDFFWVHWEVKDRDPGTVRLHVEAPRQAADPQLSEMKGRIIRAVLDSPIAEEARTAGFGVEIGKFIRKAAENKSTTVLMLTLPRKMRADSHQEDIATVDRAVGRHLNAVLEQFAAELDRQFGAA